MSISPPLPTVNKYLNQDDICSHLSASTETSIYELEVLNAVESTNTYLLDKPILCQQARVCFAKHQTAGRGRHGNQWVSDANGNITMSLSWGFPSWPATITALGLVVSYVLAERLRSEFSIPVNIKWPNDLLIEDKKLAGILIELNGQAGGSCNVVIGIGLNVQQVDLSDGADYAWQDLKGLGLEIDRNKLCAGMITDLIETLILFEQTGFQPFADKWNALNCYFDSLISVEYAGNQIQGRMLGVNDVGALLVQTQNDATVEITDSTARVRKLG